MPSKSRVNYQASTEREDIREFLKAICRFPERPVIYKLYHMSKNKHKRATAHRRLPLTDVIIMKGREIHMAYNENGLSVFDTDKLFDKDTGKLLKSIRIPNDNKMMLVNGTLEVYPDSHSNLKLIEYIEHLNTNGGNSQRNAEIEPVFYRYDQQKVAADANLRDSMLAKCFEKIFSHTTLVDSVWQQKARNFGINPIGKTFEEMKHEFLAIAKRDPEFFLNQWDSYIQPIKDMIREAQDLKLIAFVTNFKRWHYLKDGKVEKESMITESRGIDPAESILEFFVNNPKATDVMMRKISALKQRAEAEQEMAEA